MNPQEGNYYGSGIGTSISIGTDTGGVGTGITIIPAVEKVAVPDRLMFICKGSAGNIAISAIPGDPEEEVKYGAVEEENEDEDEDDLYFPTKAWTELYSTRRPKMYPSEYPACSESGGTKVLGEIEDLTTVLVPASSKPDCGDCVVGEAENLTTVLVPASSKPDCGDCVVGEAENLTTVLVPASSKPDCGDCVVGEAEDSTTVLVPASSKPDCDDYDDDWFCWQCECEDECLDYVKEVLLLRPLLDQVPTEYFDAASAPVSVLVKGTAGAKASQDFRSSRGN